MPLRPCEPPHTLLSVPTLAVKLDIFKKVDDSSTGLFMGGSHGESMMHAMQDEAAEDPFFG